MRIKFDSVCKILSKRWLHRAPSAVVAVVIVDSPALP